MELTTAQRRGLMMSRHHLGPGHRAADPVQAARGVLGLHATDPATIHLSILARVPDATTATVTAALHEDRRLVRVLGMRRTLFVVDTSDYPLIHHAAATEVTAKNRRSTLKHLQTFEVEPDLGDIDAEEWLADVAESAARIVVEQGPLGATAIVAAEPRLATVLRDRGVSQALTSRVLNLLAGDGRIVRGRPQGGWTSRRYLWEPASAWWPDGLPELDRDAARAELVRRYLERFGPATITDVRWWTGWTLTETRRALAALDTVQVRTPQGDGLVLAGQDIRATDPEESVVLLPALDATPMGWKERDWLFDLDPAVVRSQLFDTNGNIGPTVWWCGAVVGGWATRPDGSVVTHLLTDIGTQATALVDQEASRLERRLDGATVTPSFRTPLERRLATGG